MDIEKTGGPAYPTLSGGLVDDKTFRFEGMTLFDWYAGQAIAAGRDPMNAELYAKKMLELRKFYFANESKV